jgi:hypothetical protein
MKNEVYRTLIIVFGNGRKIRETCRKNRVEVVLLLINFVKLLIKITPLMRRDSQFKGMDY